MNRGGLGLAYVVKSTRIPGGYRPAAHVACAEAGCSVVETLSMTNHSNNPEWVGERMRAKGWACDGFHAGRNRCPTCVAAQAVKRRGEQPGKSDQPKGEIMVSGTKAPLAIVPAANDLAVMPPGAKPPTPTVDQKLAIRRVLDGAFDEKRGCYVDGSTDQSIAEKLGLPMIMVRNLRELAYGPLKSVPEFDVLRAEQLTLSERAATLKREATDLADQAHDLEKRMLVLATRFGIDAAVLTASGTGSPART